MLTQFSPFGQECFIGLVGCFVCFGTYCFLLFHNQMIAYPELGQNAARFVSLTTCLPRGTQLPPPDSIPLHYLFISPW
jgi:hypothetical protein